MFDWIDIERIIHSVKTMLACVIGVAIAKISGSTQGPWIVISIIVVMCAQPFVGSVIQRSLLRFLGTLLGCVIASITILAIGISDASISITIALAAFLFSYLATSNENLVYAATLGAATTAIILLAPQPTIDIAMLRFFEISAGILIATVISQFVIPIHARTHLKRSQIKMLTQLCDYYKKCMISEKTWETESDFENYDEELVKLLSKQRQLAKESKREPLGIPFDPNVFIQSLQCEKEILRAIDFMHHALKYIKKIQPITVSQAIINFNQAVIDVFNKLIEASEKGSAEKIKLTIPEVFILKKEIQQNTNQMNSDDLIYLDGYLFAVEILVRSLKQLCVLYRFEA